jgi:hypothetical protein
MLSALLMVAIIVVVGGGLSDRLRIKQEELILQKLPIAAASAYYELLVKRAARLKWLRSVALVSVFIIIYVWRKTRE